MSLPELDQRFPCPRCGTTEGLKIKMAVPRQPGVTYAVACKCGICTESRGSLREALTLWDAGAELADVLEWDSCAPREVVEDLLSKPFGDHVLPDSDLLVQQVAGSMALSGMNLTAEDMERIRLVATMSPSEVDDMVHGLVEKHRKR